MESRDDSGSVIRWERSGPADAAALYPVYLFRGLAARARDPRRCEQWQAPALVDGDHTLSGHGDNDIDLQLGESVDMAVGHYGFGDRDHALVGLGRDERREYAAAAHLRRFVLCQHTGCFPRIADTGEID